MSRGQRTFGGFVSHDSVCLVEYQSERTGMRVIEEWSDRGHSSNVAEAIDRLAKLISLVDGRRSSISLAIEQFGVFHHLMALPSANDAVLRPVIQREVQRVFGISDPIVAFTRGLPQERRDAPRADMRTVPTQLFVAGAPRDTIDVLGSRLSSLDVEIRIATVVPKAMHSLYNASGAALEPTAVLACLEGGPHLAFFLDGRLELAVDPPIALEGERASIPMMLDQVERGAVYFRQQFRGATASRLLLAARPADYETLATSLRDRLGVQVKPLFPGSNSPEAVIAMGAVLEATQPAPLDIFPHPPTFTERVRSSLRGPSGLVAASAAAALLAGLWSASQFTSLSSTRAENARLLAKVRLGAPQVDPMRQVAERRADFVKQVEFVRASRGERAALGAALGAIAEEAPAGISFDSLNVTRSATGWSATLDGQSVAAAGSQSVRALDAFVRSLRGRAALVSPSLDRFDYPAAGKDTAPATTGPVIIEFRLSFAIPRSVPGAP